MFTRIDHIGIAVNDLDAAIEDFTSRFGLTCVFREVNEEQGVEEAMLVVADPADGHPAADGGGSYIQLLRPIREDSPVGKFLGKRGEGLHHIGFGVDDTNASLAACRDAGVRTLDETARHGSMESAIGFLHPKDVHGVLTELVQAKR